MTTEPTIEYTQHTVAWPTLEMRDRNTDELNLNYRDENGEFIISFFHVGSFGVIPHLEVFGDGLNLLLDRRIQRVLKQWRKADDAHKQVSPADLIAWLEGVGAEASRYHRNPR